MRSYIVIIAQADCSPDGSIGFSYHWDGLQFEQSKEAISHGFYTRGSDDFNIGVLEGERLVDIRWMDQSIEESQKEMKKIESEIKLI